MQRDRFEQKPSGARACQICPPGVAYSTRLRSQCNGSQ